MRILTKNTFRLAVVAVLLTGVFGISRLRSEMNFFASNIEEVIESTEPPERTVARNLADLDRSDADMDALIKIAAALSAQTDRDEKTIEAAEKEIADLEKDLARFAGDLQKNPDQATFRYSGRRYSRADVVADVALKTTVLKRKRATIDRLNQSLAQRRQDLHEEEEKIRLFQEKRQALREQLLALQLAFGSLANGERSSGMLAMPSILSTVESDINKLHEKITEEEKIRQYRKDSLNGHGIRLDSTPEGSDADDEQAILDNAWSTLPENTAISSGAGKPETKSEENLPVVSSSAAVCPAVSPRSDNTDTIVYYVAKGNRMPAMVFAE